MKKFLLFIIIFGISISIKAQKEANYSVYKSANTEALFRNLYSDDTLLIIPSDSLIIVHEDQGTYRMARYGEFYGWVKMSSLKRFRKASKSDFGTFDYSNVIAPEKKAVNNSVTTPSHNSVTTPSYPISLPQKTPGTEVQVKGYYRKDGTYVRPHTRSAPRRKS